MPGVQASGQSIASGRPRRGAARSLRRFLAAALAALSLACPARGEEPPPDEELVAVVPASLAPVYSTATDGAPTGFSVDVLRHVAARAGYRLRFVTTANMEQAMRLLSEGQAQVLPGLGVSPERARRFAFTRSFETHPVYIYFRAQGPPRENLAALSGLRVALVPGSIPMERLGSTSDFSVQQAESLSQALFDLFTGDADALVYQAPRVEAAARAAGVESKLARSRQPLFEINRALAVSLERPDLLRRLDTALDEFCSSQEFRDLYRQWRPEPRPPLLTPAALWLMAALVVLLGGGLLAWRNLSLARMNRQLLAALSERDQALSAQLLSQDRMEALFTLTHMADADDTALTDFALKEGVRLTGSGMGFLISLPGQEIDLSHAHWCLGEHSCGTLKRDQSYPFAEAGIWAECLESKNPLVVNDFASDARRRGLPEGHAPISRLMVVPLVQDGKVSVVFGVANKAAPYDANDTRQLQLFLMGLWRVLEARKAAESIRCGRDYAESLIEGANAMIVGLDLEGRTMLFNAAAEEITGYGRAELLERHWFSAMLPGGASEKAAALFQDFMAGRAALPKSHEGLLRTRDGRLRHVSWQNSLLMEGGEITGVIAYGIDITEKRQAEAELRRLHRAIDQAAEGVLITDAAGAVLYANPSMGRMFAQGQEGMPLQGGSVFDLDLPVLDHHSSASKGEGSEGVWRGTCVFARPGGVPVEVEFAVSAVRSEADDLVSYVAVCRDVTEKRLLEHQLWQAQKMEALGTLAGGVAHDFNNLLASIMGFAELAQDEAPEGSRGRAYLSRVLGACMRARELVRQILSFSRRSDHKPRPLQADAAVAEAVKLLEASVPREIELTSRLAAGATILADPTQVQQVVMNLCANAAQAMQGQGGGISVSTSSGPLPAELAARHRLPPGDYLTLTVEDQGPGIAQEALGRIFDPFFTTKGPGEGTGLGLAVVHGIVTGLGGAVWAESEPGQGARFTVVLPAQPGNEEAPRQAQPQDLRGRERILLLDDEPDIRELGRQTLLPLGYQVRTQGDPQAVLDQLLDAPESIDLLLTDMSMPGLGGVALAERLRRKRADLPIVFLTGLSLNLSPDRLESLGPAWLLAKPFSTGELALAVRQALDAHKEAGHAPMHPRG